MQKSIQDMGTAWEVHMCRSGAKPVTSGERWYATYTDPSGEERWGTMAWMTAQRCWLFVPEDGGEPLYAASAALQQHGHVETAQQQYNTDVDNRLIYTQFRN